MIFFADDDKRMVFCNDFFVSLWLFKDISPWWLISAQKGMILSCIACIDMLWYWYSKPPCSLFTDISTNMVTWNSYFEGDQIMMNDSKKMRKTTLSCNVCSSSWDTTALSLSTCTAGKWSWPMTDDIDKSHDSCRYEEKILFLRNHPHLLSRNWGHQLLPHLFDKMVS